MTTASPSHNRPEPSTPANRRSRPRPPRRGRREALTAAQEHTIVARYAAGESTHELARAFDVGQTAICDVLYGAGHTPRSSGPRRLTAEQEQLLARQYAAGRNQRELAAEYGVSAGTVRNVLRRQATRTRPPGSDYLFTTEQDHEVAARYRTGTSMEVLAESYDVSVPTVRAALNRVGEPIRASSRRLAVPIEATPAIVAAYHAGASLRDLAARYKVSPGSIVRVLERQGVARRPARRLPAAIPPQAAAIATDYRADASIPTLATRYQISYGAVVKALDHHGVARRPAPGRIKATATATHAARR